MKEIKTLEDALALVPGYWYLTPKVDKWKEGDEICQNATYKKWCKVDFPFIVKEYGPIVDDTARRPIPQSVREAEARWILYNSLATVAPFEFGYRPTFIDKKLHALPSGGGLRGFEDGAFYTFQRECGGESAVIQMLTEGPGALWRWVEENRK